MLPLLKHQLNEWRWVILNPKQALPHLQRETELRRPTGDTQKLRLLEVSKVRQVSAESISRAAPGFTHVRWRSPLHAISIIMACTITLN